MSITVNDGGVLRKLGTISVNDGGSVKTLGLITANDGGVHRIIHNPLPPLPTSLTWHNANSGNPYITTNERNGLQIQVLGLKTPMSSKDNAVFCDQFKLVEGDNIVIVFNSVRSSSVQGIGATGYVEIFAGGAVESASDESKYKLFTATSDDVGKAHVFHITAENAGLCYMHAGAFCAGSLSQPALANFYVAFPLSNPKRK